MNETYPNQTSIHYPLVLELYKRGGKAKPAEIYGPLADYFNLSENLRNKTVNEETKDKKWHNNIRWARQQLVESGVLRDDSDHGTWELSNNAINKFFDIDVEHAISEDSSKVEFTQKQLEELLEKQKKIGELGEDIVVEYEKERLNSLGLVDLSQKVRRISNENCRAGYDIISYYADGTEKFIEVKSSTATSLDFYISINELEKANKLKGKYSITLVRGIDIESKTSKEIKEITDFNKLVNDNKVNLVPIKWRVALPEDTEII